MVCVLDSVGAGEDPVVTCCEHGGEPLASVNWRCLVR